MRPHFAIVRLPLALARPVLACLALAGLLSPFASAAAASSYEVATRTVNFSDLNLSRHEDVATLYLRIKSAAKQVCEPVDSRSFDTSARLRHCKERAIGQAVADVKSSQLLTFHMATTNQIYPAYR
jgi:UrcA family protein